MVPQEPARPAVATDEGSLQGLGLGGDAPADDGRGGNPVLPAFPETIPQCSDARGGRSGGGAPVLVGVGILLEGKEFVEGGEGFKNPPRPPFFKVGCKRLAKTPRHRPIHRRGDSLDPLPPSNTGCLRQHGSSPLPPLFHPEKT